MTTTYKITYAGQYESILRTRGDLSGHDTVEAAVAAVAAVSVDDPHVEFRGDGSWAVYQSEQDEADDTDGSDPIAVIEEVKQ